jgi:hypothetical protein
MTKNFFYSFFSFLFFFDSHDMFDDDWRRTYVIETHKHAIILMKESYFRDTYFEIAETRIIAWIKSNFHTMDVNQRDSHGKTLLHRAARYGFGKVVTLLLSHPAIDVNLLDYAKRTPVIRALGKSNDKGFIALLNDPRTKRDHHEEGLLWRMMSLKIPCIKEWIATGYALEYDTKRDSDDPRTWGRKFFDDMYDVETARKLVQEYFADPVKMVHQTRVELGWYERTAVGYFALLDSVGSGVHVCKGEGPTARFFSMTLRLPHELQVVMCLRLAGSSKDFLSDTSVKQGAKRLIELLELLKV